MKVGDRLFINSALMIESGADRGYGGLSSEVISERIATSDHVFIISAYYDLTFLRSLFARNAGLISLTIVVNRASASALPAQIAELGHLKKELGRLNRKCRVDVKLAASHRFLHTKLYHFRRGKWARTLVGSANVSANGFRRNDELLVELHGRDEPIEGYIDWTVSHSSSCDAVPVDVDVQDTMEAMLRDGFVYFKSHRPLPSNVNCFDQEPRIADALQKSMVAEPLPFHVEQSIGVLNILRLLGIEAPDDQRNDVKRTNMTAYSVETCFGYWVPFSLHAMLDLKIEKVSATRAERLAYQGRKLAAVEDLEIVRLLRTGYFDQVDRRLAGAKAAPLTISQRSAVERRVIARVSSLRTRLGNDEECRRLARPLSSAPVPEMWEDRRSRDEMIDSFCEYVSWRLQQAQLPLIVGFLKKRFDLGQVDTGEEVRERIEAFFAAGKILHQRDWPDGVAHVAR